MAAELFVLGVELVIAVTIGLVAVLLLRPAIRGLCGARAAYALWLLVPAVVVAIALPRAAAPLASAAGPTAAIATPATPAVVAPVLAQASQVFEIERPVFMPNLADFAAPLLLLWLVGAVAFATLLVAGQVRFLNTLGALRREQRGPGAVYYAARGDIGPALVGALVPRIILPRDFGERFSREEQDLVIAHERVHLTSGDAQINLAIALARVLLWFHPLVHVCARIIRTDQELACDETVIARRPTLRRTYAEAMLKAQFATEPAPVGCHWRTGDERELRRRIQRLKSMPSRTRRTVGAGVAAIVTLGGGAAAWALQPPVPVASSQAVTATSVATRDLMRAIQAGDNSQALALIDAGADINGWTLDEGSPLILAVREGQIALARRLLDRGANPNLAVPGEGAALILAADAGDLAMVELLLNNRASPDIAVEGDGNPLIAAAANGHVQIVDRLLAAGASVDAVVPRDETALITAARFGHLPVVRTLVDHGADVNLAVLAPRAPPLAPELRSPLGMARRAGRTDMVDYLRANGARA